MNANIEANSSSAKRSCHDATTRTTLLVASTCLFVVLSMLIQPQASASSIRNAVAFHSGNSVPIDKDTVQRSTIASSSIDMVPDPLITSPPSDSMFEKLWPGYMLPPWAQKAYNYDVPRNQSMCFVHVGKAGGSAVGCSLGFSLHCGSATQVDGTLPKITTTIFHKDVYNCHEDDARYLFVIRDPIDRARSAFNYDRPDEVLGPTADRYTKYYDGCSFSTIEEMTQNGLSEHGNSSSKCKYIAHQAIRGKGWIAPSHFYYNYQYYWESLPDNSSIIAIRNEHLNDDWNALEERISGMNGIMNEETMPTINANAVDQLDLFISDESLGILCEALCNEIQVYKIIIMLAENLNEDQVKESLDALALKCPKEATIDTCPEAMPDIKRKLERNRGYGPEDEETLE